MLYLIVSFAVFFAAFCVVGWGMVRNLPRSRRAAIAYLLGAILFFGGILNFLIYWHIAVYIGGNATRGKVEHGRYFVSSHGRLTEVSPTTWRYSYGHAMSTWIGSPVIIFGWLLMYLADRQRTKPADEWLKPPPHESPGP